MYKKQATVNNQIKETKTLFSKEQLLSSERFRNRRDILNALLKDGESYSFEDADSKINQYLKGKVK